MKTVFPRSFPFRKAIPGMLLITAVILNGCATVPSGRGLHGPTLETPLQWAAVPADSQGAISNAWWQDFGDQVLNGLIDEALDANRDVQILAARLAQARALIQGTEAEQGPRVDVVASGQRGRDSTAAPRVERSGLGLRAAWELDLFGWNALMLASVDADTESVRHALHAARIALAADVTTTYFELRTLEQRLMLKRQATEVAQQQAEVALRKFKAGQATLPDVERWQAELAQERAAIAQIDGDRRVRMHQLALLLGKSQMPTLGVSAIPIAAPPPPAPLLPAELLERRPDVLRQARAVDAALARTGMARHEVYPKLQIAWAGTQERLAALGESAAPRLVVGYGISLSLPILDSGRIRANIAVQDARVQEAMAEYEKAMLVALVDVENSFTKWSASGNSLQQWQRAEAAGKVAERSVQRLYEAGNADLGAVLEARQLHLLARDAVAQAMGARWEAAVSLRRAFAGKI